MATDTVPKSRVRGPRCTAPRQCGAWPGVVTPERAGKHRHRPTGRMHVAGGQPRALDRAVLMLTGNAWHPSTLRVSRPSENPVRWDRGKAIPVDSAWVRPYLERIDRIPVDSALVGAYLARIDRSRCQAFPVSISSAFLGQRGRSCPRRMARCRGARAPWEAPPSPDWPDVRRRWSAESPGQGSFNANWKCLAPLPNKASHPPTRRRWRLARLRRRTAR